MRPIKSRCANRYRTCIHSCIVAYNYMVYALRHSLDCACWNIVRLHARRVELSWAIEEFLTRAYWPSQPTSWASRLRSRQSDIIYICNADFCLFMMARGTATAREIAGAVPQVRDYWKMFVCYVYTDYQYFEYLLNHPDHRTTPLLLLVCRTSDIML